MKTAMYYAASSHCGNLRHCGREKGLKFSFEEGKTVTIVTYENPVLAFYKEVIKEDRNSPSQIEVTPYFWAGNVGCNPGFHENEAFRASVLKSGNTSDSRIYLILADGEEFILKTDNQLHAKYDYSYKVREI